MRFLRCDRCFKDILLEPPNVDLKEPYLADSNRSVYPVYKVKIFNDECDSLPPLLGSIPVNGSEFCLKCAEEINAFINKKIIRE